MAKSLRIFDNALTWFLWRTVPTSRNAKPACMASTRMAPMRMNRVLEPWTRESIALCMFSMK
ncbi:hypothetical protein D3C71_2033960 [compost metagenome]